MLIFLKTLHLITAIFFIGCVYFRTLIVPRIKPSLGTEKFGEVESLLAIHSRRFGSFNNALLFISGLCLYYLYFDSSAWLLHFKAFLGLLLVVLFYLAPFFVPPLTRSYAGFKSAFHRFLLGMMLLLVVLSQALFLL